MSQKGKPRRSHRKLLQWSPALDQSVTQIEKDIFWIPTPPILYHYTAWSALSGILSTQRFWATTHHSMDDEAELVAADAVIVATANELRSTATGITAEVLAGFIRTFPQLRLGKLMSVCLVCFSTARDDARQWEIYGDDGHGVCLGLSVLDEPPPPSKGGLVKVDYCESSWREKLTAGFTRLCALLGPLEPSIPNLQSGVAALYRIAAFASITAKQQQWAHEKEFRKVELLVFKDDESKLLTRVSGGKTRLYLPLSVRTEGKLIALSEIIVGPNQEFDAARYSVKVLLAESGYKPDQSEYPKIVPSEVPPWSPSGFSIKVSENRSQ